MTSVSATFWDYRKNQPKLNGTSLVLDPGTTGIAPLKSLFRRTQPGTLIETNPHPTMCNRLVWTSSTNGHSKPTPNRTPRRVKWAT